MERGQHQILTVKAALYVSSVPTIKLAAFSKGDK